MRTPIVSAFASVLIASLIAPSIASPAELPIRQIVLYKHGVGFFERSGSIPAGDAARLDFKASEMNDVLKSLMINGKNERVSGLRYDSSIPLDQKLSEFPFRIEQSQPLSGVLDQLKGARLELQIGSSKLSGMIVAARVVPGDKDRAERQQLVLLLDSSDMQTIDLDAASSIRFTDPKLQGQFREYLGAMTAARSKDKRSVYIDGSAGGRDVTADYIIPTPIWKSSYRLLFTDAGEPTLEGWAIVDNTTGEDWTNVQMSLVSGKPISFISELYAPRYIRRELAELPEEQAQRPEVYEGSAGLLPSNAYATNGTTDTVNVSSASNGILGSLSLSAAPKPAAVERLQQFTKSQRAQPSSVVAGATGAELADLFQYRIAQPVSIKQNESAMLPFLQDKIKARKIDIYSDTSSKHPLNAAELTNSTSKTLDGGPITVYDGGGYVGEALVETVKANDKRLISYGVDLGMRITNRIDSEEREERELHLKRGILMIRVATVRKTTYTLNNVDPKAKTLIIEHPLNDAFKVLNQKPSETTSKARRFEVKLGASASDTFPVVEENLQDETTVVSSLTPDVLVEFLKNKSLTDTGRRDLQQIVDMKRQIAEASNDSQATKTKITNVTQDEERVRQNLGSLNRVSGQQDLVQKYATQLAGLETQIATLRDHESAVDARQAQLQSSLDDHLDKMTF